MISRSLRLTKLVLALGGTLVVTAVLAPRVSTQGRQGPQGPSRRAVVNGAEVMQSEVLVLFRLPHTAADRAQLAAQIGGDEDEEVGSLGVRRIHSSYFDTETLLGFFQSRPDVLYTEPNYVLRPSTTPNDPQFGQLWGLRNLGTPGADIHAVSAWDVSTGSRNTVVAVVDTGIDYTHPDLAANVWSAPAAFTVKIGRRTITCAAGTHGFNAVANTCDPMDDHNHGTHVSGTIAATGNNGVGVVGVNWTGSLMGAKFMDATGSGTTAGAINAIDFVIQAKQAFASTAGANVRVLSNSWGGGSFSQSLLNEIVKANSSEMLFVAAAGNDGSNNDVTPFYPARYSAPNVVAVAATDSTDGLAGFSNYGRSSVHLGAPGVNIRSTTIGGTYATASGTSMATPHVSGAAALLLSVCALDTAALKGALLGAVDPTGSLAGFTTTGGRLNVDTAIRTCSAPAAPAVPTGLAAAAGNAHVALTWNASSGATSYTVKRSTTTGTEVAIASGVLAASYTDTTAVNGTTYFYVVSAVNSTGESPNSAEVTAKPVAPLVPAAPTGLTASAGPAPRKIKLSWNASAGATSYVVKRGTTSGGPYPVAAGGVTSTSYTDSSVSSGQTYYYIVSAVNAAGESAPSNQASATAK